MNPAAQLTELARALLVEWTAVTTERPAPVGLQGCASGSLGAPAGSDLDSRRLRAFAEGLGAGELERIVSEDSAIRRLDVALRQLT
jgi:hypothetical protein